MGGSNGFCEVRQGRAHPSSAAKKGERGRADVKGPPASEMGARAEAGLRAPNVSEDCACVEWLTRRGHLSAQGNHTTTGACGGIGLVSTHDPSRASLFYFLLVIYFLLF